MRAMKFKCRQFCSNRNRRTFFWIKFWREERDTCLKRILHIVRKSFLVDTWTNYSFHLKKYGFYRNTEEGHLVYSYSSMPGLISGRLVLWLESKILSKFRHKNSGTKSIFFYRCKLIKYGTGLFIHVSLSQIRFLDTHQSLFIETSAHYFLRSGSN